MQIPWFNWKFIACTPCLKCHVQNKLTRLRKLLGCFCYSFVSHLFLTSWWGWAVSVRKWDFSRPVDLGEMWKWWKCFIFSLETIIVKATLVMDITRSFSSISLRIQCFITQIWCISCAQNLNLTKKYTPIANTNPCAL